MREPKQPNLNIKEFTIPDFEDIKINDTRIQDYLDISMFFKFKERIKTGNIIGLDWIVAASI